MFSTRQNTNYISPSSPHPCFGSVNTISLFPVLALFLLSVSFVPLLRCCLIVGKVEARGRRVAASLLCMFMNDPVKRCVLVTC